MKFLHKINRQYFWILIILLILISFPGYFTLRAILNNKMREDILEKEYAIVKEIETKNNLPSIYPIIETKEIVKNQIEPKSYQKVSLTDEAENEIEPFIEYTNTVKINNHYYLIKLRHSLLENNNLILAIAIPFFLLLVLAFAVSFILTKKFNKTIWKDFEDNLKEIEHFSFENSQELLLQDTDIEEFNRLNKTINRLTSKLRKDYQILKHFTENASHEIQTPLSIILINLEELLQQDISEQAFKQVVSTINATKRLSSLNQSLILLTKIENNQFYTENELIINDILEQKIQEFSPLLEKLHLKINYKALGKFVLKLNGDLANILINNLLSNTIKHNIQDGIIDIKIQKTKIKICNTGKKNSLNNVTIFNRFTKENSHSYGLGLAVVKQICDNHNLQIQYSKTKLHCFIINKLQ